MKDERADLVERAARALRRGDPLFVLTLTAGIDGAQALALRGAALAQLDETADARACLERAVVLAERARDGDTSARATLALGELAVSHRDFDAAVRHLDRSASAVAAQPENRALHALLRARVDLFRGRPRDAARKLAAAGSDLDPFLTAIVQLAHAEVELASADVDACLRALQKAHAAARASKHAFLLAEVEAGLGRLTAPRARLWERGKAREIDVLEIARRRATPGGVLVDALRAEIAVGSRRVDLSRRPLLFSLLYRLAQAAPSPVDRGDLVAVLGARKVNESHLATLRVELGRLRRLLPKTVRIATVAGNAPYRLEIDAAAELVLLEPLDPSARTSISALLSDGEAWKTDDIASALQEPKRTVQRRLSELREGGELRVVGTGKNARWASANAAQFTILGQLSALFGARSA